MDLVFARAIAVRQDTAGLAMLRGLVVDASCVGRKERIFTRNVGLRIGSPARGFVVVLAQWLSKAPGYRGHGMGFQLVPSSGIH
jgi:hypothetical protein